ncbi:MAG: GIY-YIG nuclease family protein [Rikenellaceae bacterium]
MNKSYIYFVTNKNNTALYVGVTSNLQKRILEHKGHERVDSFSDRYNCVKLVYFEEYGDIRYAIAREKQLKNWKREWKNKLIESLNPEWNDLME